MRAGSVEGFCSLHGDRIRYAGPRSSHGGAGLIVLLDDPERPLAGNRKISEEH